MKTRGFNFFLIFFFNTRFPNNPYLCIFFSYMNRKITNIKAGLKVRFLSFFMDAVITALPSLLLIILFLFLFKPGQSASAAITLLTPFILFVLYFTFFTVKSQSLGQRYFGIAVTANNENLSFAKSLVRSFLKVILGWISWILIPGSSNKTSLHDILCKTGVFYLENSRVFNSDKQERITRFLQKAVVITPIISLLVFIYYLVVKITMKSAVLVSGNILIYIIYILIPAAFYTSLLGMVVSFQSIKGKIYPKKFGFTFLAINAIFLVILSVVVIRAACSM